MFTLSVAPNFRRTARRVVWTLSFAAWAATALSAAQAVEQPAAARVAQAPADLYVYPARGQSRQQLAADRNECHAWAVAQAGYDPNNASTGFQVGRKRLDYDRAITACLVGRGYTVK
jgi:hypothetical protein